MCEFIKREDALKQFTFTTTNPAGDGLSVVLSLAEARNLIQQVPPADAERTRHGYWIKRDKTTAACSNCLHTANLSTQYEAFCSYCGSRMDIRKETQRPEKLYYDHKTKLFVIDPVLVSPVYVSDRYTEYLRNISGVDITIETYVVTSYPLTLYNFAYSTWEREMFQHPEKFDEWKEKHLKEANVLSSIPCRIWMPAERYDTIISQLKEGNF